MDNLNISYVSSIFKQDIKIKCKDEITKKALKKIGANNELLNFNLFHIKHTNENELSQKLMILRDMGIAFAGGSSGWPPASVVEHLIQKNIFKGGFKEIT